MSQPPVISPQPHISDSYDDPPENRFVVYPTYSTASLAKASLAAEAESDEPEERNNTACSDFTENDFIRIHRHPFVANRFMMSPPVDWMEMQIEEFNEILAEFSRSYKGPKRYTIDNISGVTVGDVYTAFARA